MISIIFKMFPGQSPFLDIPGLQMRGSYQNLALAELKNIAEIDMEKHQATVLENPELFQFANFLGATDDHTMIPSAAEDLNMKPVPLTPEEAAGTVDLFRLLLRRKLEIKYTERFKSTQMNVAPHERDTWEIQKREAKAFLADPQAELEFLPALAQERGVELREMAERILSKAAAYTTAITKLLGAQQKFKDKLKAAVNLRDLRRVEREIDEA